MGQLTEKYLRKVAEDIAACTDKDVSQVIQHISNSMFRRQAADHFLKGFNSITLEREWSKEECLTNGMSEKEYNIQKALGSLPIHKAYTGYQALEGLLK